jgi:protein TonB
MNTIWKIISIASFGLLIYQVFFQEDNIKDLGFQPIEYEYSGPVCYIAEEMPRFPGCENSNFSKKERQSCANKKMLEFVYSNIKYPGGYGCIEGRSVVQFTVRKDGSLVDIKIVKSLSSQFDDEIVKMLKKMPRWIPGKQNGKTVNVRYTLPIKIRLE